MMLSLIIIIILITMLMSLGYAIIGETVYDKTLATNLFGTITVCFICVYGFMTERPDFIDIAMVYALINFITTIAILRFFELGDRGKKEE